jgi:hypothetical protein
MSSFHSELAEFVSGIDHSDGEKANCAKFQKGVQDVGTATTFT